MCHGGANLVSHLTPSGDTPLRTLIRVTPYSGLAEYGELVLLVKDQIRWKVTPSKVVSGPFACAT